MMVRVPSTGTTPICSDCSVGWSRTRSPALGLATNCRSLLTSPGGHVLLFWLGGGFPCGGSSTSTLCEAGSSQPSSSTQSLYQPTLPGVQLAE